MEGGKLWLRLANGKSRLAFIAVIAVAGLCRAGLKDVQVLIRYLEGPDAASRTIAARDLGKLGPKAKAALPALVRALDDEDVKVRSEVAVALGKIGPDAKEVIPALIQQLEDPESIVRARIVETLGKIGPETDDVLPALIRALNDTSPRVRSDTIHALGRIGPEAEQAGPALISLLIRDRRVHSELTYALAAIGPAILPKLTDALQTQDDAVQDTAARALGRMGPLASPAADQLRVALHDEHVGVQVAAAWALGEIGPDAKDAVPDLVEAIEHGKDRLHSIAIDALGKIGPDAKHALPTIIASLRSSNVGTRIAAAKALGDIGPVTENVVPALSTALKDKDAKVRLKAVTSLWKIGPAAGRAVPGLVEVMKDEGQQVQSWAVKALAAIGPDAAPAVPALIKTLDHHNKTTRWYAREALYNIGPPAKKAVPSLIRVLKNYYDEIGADDSKQIERIGRDFKNSAAYLIVSLHQRDSNVRIASARALREDGPEIRQQLQELLEFPAYSAIANSWLLGLNGQTDELIHRLESGDTRVREVSALVLAEYGDSRALKELLNAAARSRGYRHESWRKRALKFKQQLPQLLEEMRASKSVRHRVLADFMRVELADPNRINEFNYALGRVTRFMSRVAWGMRHVYRAGATLARDNLPAKSRRHPRFGGRQYSDAQDNPLRQDYLPLLEALCLFDEGLSSRHIKVGVGVAASALKEFKEPKPKEDVPHLLGLLQEQDEQMRIYALANLSRWGSQAKEAVPVLISLLDYHGTDICCHAVSTLGEIGPGSRAAVLPLLETLSQTETDDLRALISLSLAKVGSAAVPSLVQTLRDGNSNARIYAARTLGRMGPSAVGAVLALTEALSDEEFSVQVAAKEALRQIQERREKHNSQN